jgi:hypothetical protein
MQYVPIHRDLLSSSSSSREVPGTESNTALCTHTTTEAEEDDRGGTSDETQTSFKRSMRSPTGKGLPPSGKWQRPIVEMGGFTTSLCSHAGCLQSEFRSSVW